MADDSEAWKGEPDPYDGQSIFSSIFGPVTPEQKAAREKAVAEAIAKGEAAWLTMTHLRGREPCVKCGAEKVKLVWSPGGGIYSVCPSGAGRHGHMHVTCRDCKYQWCRKALDEA